MARPRDRELLALNNQQWRTDQLHAKELVMLVSFVIFTIITLDTGARYQLCAVREKSFASGQANPLSGGQDSDLAVAIWTLYQKEPMTGMSYQLVCKYSCSNRALHGACKRKSDGRSDRNHLA
jgi:hypothetical protein